MKLITLFLTIIVLPFSITCMPEQDREEERKELRFEWRYINSVNLELLNKQKFLTWTGSAGFGYALIKSAQAKKGGALAGLSATAISGAGFAYLEHELQKNNIERKHIAKRFQQLTDK